MADIPHRRTSVFREIGLNAVDSPTSLDAEVDSPQLRPHVERQQPKPKLTSTLFPWPSPSISVVNRVGLIALLLATIIPFLPSASFGHAAIPLQPVSGGPVPQRESALSRRADSPTAVCLRWSQQSAVVNGTLYLYGGQATTESGQTENAWNNDFLTLDLTKTWKIADPALIGLPQPSGPPAVSNGYLWNSINSLYLYGGEFSWKPVVSPVPFTLWEYDVLTQSWIDHSSPLTSSGDSAPDGGQPVEQAAEGAGANIVGLGRGFYFGGHLDGYTTTGWSQSIPREYLQSLLEFTFPGYSNDQVSSLSGGTVAGSSGAFRNITQGGLQSSAGFTKRADGLLIYVPGFGAQGILLALAGGTNQTFTQMNEIDIYDIATSSWYIQSTSGPSPPIRVDPCAVVAAAPDGSSYNIYMFGGQDLSPLGSQTEHDDMWILTLPSFTWIQVDQNGQSVPYGRSGQTCNIWDGQMVMVGGYVGPDLSCESPAIYVFDLSNLQWVQQFTALSPGSTPLGDNGPWADPSSSKFKSSGTDNPYNQQPAQMFNSSSPGGLQGSFGYSVPAAVISVIGGGPTGGATVTAPVVTASSGPLATGKPITYTVTEPNGATATETIQPGNSGNGSGGGSSNDHGSGTNVAAIVIGVVAGVLFIIVCYLAFCAYVYRKQLRLYKNHLDMTQRQTREEKPTAFAGLLAPESSATPSSDYREPNRLGSASNSSRVAVASSSSQARSGRKVDPANHSLTRESDASSTEDLLAGQEPTFVGVMLNPRRSLRVINRD